MATTVMPPVRPQAAQRTHAPANAESDRYRMLQAVLFTVGATLMPGGLIAVGFGWYGAASTKYAYDQFPYLLSGGLLGVCLTTLGGFLYFGAWQAKVAADQKNASMQLADAVFALTDLLSWQATQSQLAQGGAGDPRGALVVAGDDGAVVHRRDCGLIAQRSDLRAATPLDGELGVCRVCHPSGA